MFISSGGMLYSCLLVVAKILLLLCPFSYRVKNLCDRTTRNPHDPDRYTGGSSSGPAAIVALGLCSAALGTDGGGCTFIPCQTEESTYSIFINNILLMLDLMCKDRFSSDSFFPLWCCRFEVNIWSN